MRDEEAKKSGEIEKERKGKRKRERTKGARESESIYDVVADHNVRRRTVVQRLASVKLWLHRGLNAIFDVFR